MTQEKINAITWNGDVGSLCKYVAQAQAEVSFRVGVGEGMERIIKYLKIRWCSYGENEITGLSRHTFELPKNWEESLKKQAGGK